MSDINPNNMIDVQDSTLKAGQRVIAIETEDGTVAIPVGVGSFVAGGKVFVEAPKRRVNTTATEATLNVVGNMRYEFGQPLSKLAINSIDGSALESVIVFTAGENFVLTLPTTVTHTIGRLLAGDISFESGKTYIISIRYTEAVASELESTVEA
jgi:hypothetical protein